MALYPRAEYRPLGRQTESRMSAHNILCVHQMVGYLAGTDSMFGRDGYYGTESHFGLGGSSDGARDGHVIQWQDTEFGADANLEGKGDVISIETSDGGDPNQPLSPKQLDALVELGIWVCDTYDIPPVLIPDTKPGRRGIGYHRQGCDHSSSYRPRGWPYDAWRVPGGRRWSKALGKTCPGDVRIRQLIDIVIPRIKAGMTGGGGGAAPAPEQGVEDMAFEPHTLPDTAGEWAYMSFPVEAGARSSVVADLWFTLYAAWGSNAEYQIVCSNYDGKLIGTLSNTPTSGTIPERKRLHWKLDPNCNGLALKYKTNDNCQLSYAFPSRAK
jgi:hypothetical protein